MIRLSLRRPEPAQGGDPAQPHTPPPPAAGDILAAVRAYGWPALEINGRLVEGEDEWRDFVEDLTGEERPALWKQLGSSALRAPDAEEEADSQEADADEEEAVDEADLEDEDRAGYDEDTDLEEASEEEDDDEEAHDDGATVEQDSAAQAETRAEAATDPEAWRYPLWHSLWHGEGER